MTVVTVQLDRASLCPWYFAVSWARIRVQQSVAYAQECGWSTKYEEAQLERLLEMEQFIKMTWDQALDGDLLPQTVLEVK